MQREVIKWLQTLDLSHPVKNPHRDLANGFTVAEIISRYADVLPMHAVTTGVSKDSRRQNWRQILAALQRLHCSTITEQLVDAILRLQPNAAMVVLERLYEFFTHRALPAHSLIAADDTNAMLTRVVAPHEAMSEETPDEALTAAMTCAEGVLSAMANTLPRGHTTITPHRSELPPRLNTVTAAQEALALTRNDELARVGVRQLAGVRPLPPGFTQPTTATLLHEANHMRQQIVLAKDKYEDDELSARIGNEAIEQQHMQLQRARRTAQETGTTTVMPQRSLTERLRGRSVGLQKERPTSAATQSALLPHTTSRARLQSNATNAQRTRRSTAGRSQGGDSDARTIAGATSVLNGSAGVSVGGGGTGLVPKLKVNVMRAELMEALRNNGVTAEFGARAGQKSVEFFAACGHSLRKAFSSLLKDVLAAHHELYNVLEWCGEHSEGSVLQDLLTAVIAYRDALQPTTLRACWVALEQNVDGIAAAIDARQDEYAYLLHALSYVFTSDSAHVALLHVSDLASAAPRPAQSEDAEDTADSAGATRTTTQSSEPPPPNTRAQAVWYDRRASHLASAFVFLGKVGEALRRRGPETALRALQLGFLPNAQSTLLLHGSPAIVEAVGRVIVSHLCHFTPFPMATSNDSEREKSRTEWLEQHAQQAEALVTLLEQVASSLVREQREQQQQMRGDNGQAVRRVRREGAAASRFYLLLYHVLRHVTNKLQGSLASSALHDALLHRVWHEAFTPLVMLTHRSIAPALTSEQVSTRCVAVGLLTLLVMWRQEELACSLIASLQPAVNAKLQSTQLFTAWVTSMIHGGGTIAVTWELRLWLLELLTLLFRHTVQRMVTAQRRNAAATQSEEEGTLGDKASCQRLREMEQAGLVCLESFLRSAPASQRQLALSVVGGRLLPEYQPRLAARWLRAVLHCPSAALRSRLLPWNVQQQQQHVVGQGGIEEQALYSSGNGNGGGGALRPTRLRRATLAALDLAAEESNMNAAMLDRLPNVSSMSLLMLQGSASASARAAQLSGARPVSANTTAPGEATPHEKALTQRGSEEEDEDSSGDGMMSVLLGKVEPAYVISPLNQSWNTCGVVHLVLQHLHWMTPEQVLTIVAAALLSPQRLSVQAAQLLHDVYLTLSRHTAQVPASADTELDASCATNAAASGEDDGAVELAVTLHSLVLPHVQHDTAEDAKGKDGGERDAETLWRDLDACRTEGPSRLPQAFWRSVLRRLLPLIRTCLSVSSSASASGEETEDDDDDEEEGASRSSQTSTPHEKTPSEEARELAWLVLSCLHRTYIPHKGNDESMMMDVDEMLESATRWARAPPVAARN